MRRIVVTVCLLLLCGCVGSFYERSSDRASIYVVNMDEINEKIENDETFMFMMGREDCSSCWWIYNFYKVELPNDETHIEAKKAMEFVEKNPNPEEFLFDQYLPTDVLTPSFYFIKDGNVEDIYIGMDWEWYIWWIYSKI